MKNFRKILFIVAFIVISAVLPCIMGNVNAVAYQSVIAEEIQDNKLLILVVMMIIYLTQQKRTLLRYKTAICIRNHEL